MTDSDSPTLPLTTAALDEYERLARAATPEPNGARWVHVANTDPTEPYPHWFNVWVECHGGGLTGLPGRVIAPEHIAAYIAALSPSVVLALVEAARRGAEKPELPGGAEMQLGDWSQAETCLGGRSDDAPVYLSVHGRRDIAVIPLGWFREHTSFGLWEDAIKSNRADDADADFARIEAANERRQRRDEKRRQSFGEQAP